ncbi:MAG: hypothetical protein V2A61_05675 [Calditrichota bacterium]
MRRRYFYILLGLAIGAGSLTAAELKLRSATETLEPSAVHCIGNDLAQRTDSWISPVPVPPYRHFRQVGAVFRPLNPKDQSDYPHITAWIPSDSVSIDTRIPIGAAYALRINPGRGQIESISPDPGFPEIVQQAVQRAPQWLRHDLTQNFEAMWGDAGGFFRELFAQQILETEEPYVDELAFLMAHISPDLVCTGAIDGDLLAENVQGVYAADEYLDYVRIEDHGSVEDGQYWSTLIYNIKTAEGDTVELELDPEIYYWWVVHPRLSDERPQYIGPQSGRFEAPPTGKFWRDFLMNHADEGYPLLRDRLEGCQVLWSNLRCDGTPANGAVGILNQWVLDCMVFDSRQERPIQPVRIIALHMGRCGEHQDLVAAAGRAALIPVTSTSCIVNDHVWNAFYAGRWVVWEPVGTNIDDSTRYDGWRPIPGLFDWRGDGYVETVTARHTAGVADLAVHITDRSDRPIDGARIGVYSEYIHGNPPYYWCTYGFTDRNGWAVIKVGDERNIYVRVDTEIGAYPPPGGGVVRVIENCEANRRYEWPHQIDAEKPSLLLTEIDPPDEPAGHYRLTLNYQPIISTVRGRVFQYSTFFADIYPAALKFFLCDETNYQHFREAEPFEAMYPSDLSEEGSATFVLPNDHPWFALYSNNERVSTLNQALVEGYLYRDENWGTPDLKTEPGIPAEFALYPNYPNPFNAQTTLRFDLAEGGPAALIIYDLRGSEAASLRYNFLLSGRFKVSFNGSQLAGGVYFCRLETTSYSHAIMITLLK